MQRQSTFSCLHVMMDVFKGTAWSLNIITTIFIPDHAHPKPSLQPMTASKRYGICGPKRGSQCRYWHTDGWQPMAASHAFDLAMSPNFDRRMYIADIGWYPKRATLWNLIRFHFHFHFHFHTHTHTHTREWICCFG